MNGADFGRFKEVLQGHSGALGDTCEAINVIRDETNVKPTEASLVDTREQLEADIKKAITFITSTAMWPPSANKKTEHVSTTFDEITEWLDRQAAITERECMGEHVLESPVCATCKEGASRLRVENTKLQAEVDEFERTHLRLPVDADGVPIRPGDTIVYREIITSYDCDTLVLYEDGEWRVHTTDSGLLNPRECRHVQPDTVESVLEEYAQDKSEDWRIACDRYFREHCWSKDWQQDPEFSVIHRDNVAEYAERIRKVVEQ